MSGVRSRLGVLCDQLSRHSSMRQLIRDAGAGAELDELQTMLRGDAAADTERAKVLLDAVDHACARDGLAAVTARGYGDSRLPAGFGQPPDAVEQDKWVCPQGRCGRVVFADETPSPPVCAATDGGPMRTFRIRP